MISLLQTAAVEDTCGSLLVPLVKDRETDRERERESERARERERVLETSGFGWGLPKHRRASIRAPAQIGPAPGRCLPICPKPENLEPKP